MLKALTLLVTLSAPPVKITVPPLAPGDGTTPAMLTSLSEAIAAELRKQAGYEVLTYQDIQAVLSHEQTKDALACNEVACYAEMGSALGVAELVTGSLGRVGTSWLVNLKIVDVRAVAVISAANRRIKGGTLDDVLDVLPALVTELTGPQRQAPAAPMAPTLPAPGPLPAAAADRPLADPGLVARLTVLTNGKGRYLAYDAQGDLYGPLFAGSATALYKQRVTGGGRNKGEKSFDQVFWEPRVRERWRASFAGKAGTFTLQCNEATESYRPLAAKEVKAWAKQAKLYDVRWQRQAIFIARDDYASYYFVDQAREPEGNRDFRLFMGAKGKLAYLPVTDAIADAESTLYVTDAGKLVVSEHNGKPAAVWKGRDGDTPLAPLDLYAQAPFVYTELQAYAGQTLGTACDHVLGK